MEFGDKLQELRKQKNLTQEELSERLFVSRTAVSKWESGRGCPSIESLKAIASFFQVSIDTLLDGSELLQLAEQDKRQSAQNIRDIALGLLDCAMFLLLFIPLFTQRSGETILQVSLLALKKSEFWIKYTNIALILLISVWGITILALQNCTNRFWSKLKITVSLALSALAVLFFMAGMEPYAASFAFLLLMIKGVLLLKRP